MQGVWERDEWRGNDSFEAFEEVFAAAKRHNSDLVLLGGDLFHDNKPSRNTVIKCLDILHRNCLGDKPIAFQVCPAKLQPLFSANLFHMHLLHAHCCEFGDAIRCRRTQRRAV